MQIESVHDNLFATFPMTWKVPWELRIINKGAWVMGFPFEIGNANFFLLRIADTAWLIFPPTMQQFPVQSLPTQQLLALNLCFDSSFIDTCILHNYHSWIGDDSRMHMMQWLLKIIQNFHGNLCHFARTQHSQST